MNKTLVFCYDAARDCMVIEGIRYSGDLFRQLGGILPLGTPFQIEARLDSGALVVTRLDNKEAV